MELQGGGGVKLEGGMKVEGGLQPGLTRGVKVEGGPQLDGRVAKSLGMVDLPKDPSERLAALPLRH